MALDFLSGYLGGVAGVLAGHPLDTLKVHVQAGRGSLGQCARALRSPDALYRGVGAPLAGVAGINALVFGVYGLVRRSMSDQDSLQTHAIAGATSGLIQSFITGPVELIKTRQQLADPVRPGQSSCYECARHIVKTQKFRGLFRGLGVTIARDAPAFAIYFGSYEALTRGNSSPGRVFAAGGIAGILSWVCLYPVDVVKSRLQADNRYRNSWDCFKSTIRECGWRSMTRGLAPVTARAFIANAACFTVVAWTVRVAEAAALAQDVLAESAYRTFLFSAALGEAIFQHDVIEVHADFLRSFSQRHSVRHRSKEI